MAKELSPEKKKRADALSVKILTYSRNTLLMNLRFMEKAIGLLEPTPYEGTVGVDGRFIYFDSRFILTEFQRGDKNITRTMLHMILHCVFRHFIVAPTIQREAWDLACDMVIEEMLIDLGYPDPNYRRAAQQRTELNQMRSKVKYMTAEMVYSYIMDSDIREKKMQALKELFAEDDHSLWYKYEKPDGKTSPDTISNDTEESNEDSEIIVIEPMSQDELDEKWKDISKEMQLEIEAFINKQGVGSDSLVQNLQAVNRERYDYAEFLRKFAVYGEEMKIDEDSFDYNFYCYGLEQYGNAAIIEPLEYSDVKRIREFVIAIDTSGSVRGKTVQNFLQKTYNILSQQENFFSRVNIHIIQCDASVQEDAKITNTKEFEEYLKTIELRGFGGTDFRPVFRYVNKMIENHEFENLRGLIYFTDGYGTFPEHQPPYNAAFVFVDDEYNNYDVPVWAMKLILSTNEIIEDE